MRFDNSYSAAEKVGAIMPISCNQFARKVYDVVKCIPMGRVMSYGQVAMAAGYFGAARAVGRALHNNPDPNTIPCHRVVFATGKCSPAFMFGGIEQQQAMLISEGVNIVDNKVDKSHFVTGVLVNKNN